MKTKAVRIHGKMDLRLEEIELPPVGPDDVQVKIISDSICMSTYKAAVEGEEHKRVPNDVAEHPTIVGHEFCGVITEVGENWKNKYKPGQGFAIQPAHFYKGSQMAPGYSYQYCGGDSQYSNIPIETLLTDNLLPYNSDTYFYGSLAEPMSCIIGTFHAMYHTKPGCYEHQMGIVEGGKMAMLASVGPMGLGAIDYALHCDRRPSLLVITDIDDAKLEEAKKNGATYTINSLKEDVPAKAHELTEGYGPTVTIDAACVKGSLLTALQATGNAGRVITMGFSIAPDEINQFVITSKELDVRGSRLQNHRFQTVIDLINKGKIDLNGSISHTFKLTDAQAAFDFNDTHDPSIRKIALLND